MRETSNKYLFMFLAIAVVGVSSAFGTADPMEIMKNVALNQASDNFIPAAIMWILGLTGAVSAVGRTIYPLVFGIVASIVLALAPDLANSFTSYDFATNDGNASS